ncbi:MAG: MFS transporter [Nocardioides sp.]
MIALVIVADVMDLLDTTIANLAGPSIRSDLGGGESALQWVLTAYTTVFAVGLVVSARVGDRLGRRCLFITGMVGFTAASLLSGLAPTVGLLVAARAVQGLFGALMIPQGLAMVKQSFVARDLQKAFTPFAPIMGLAAVLGPILAGVILHADLWGTGWRMIFLINLPVGIIGTALAVRYLPRGEPDTSIHIDLGGSVLLAAASGLLIFPLVQGRELGWPAWVWGMLAASAALFAAFGWRERNSSHPVIEPTLFHNRGFVAGVVFLGTFFTPMNGVMLIVNLFLQLGLGYPPLKTGAAMTALAVGLAIGAALSGAWLGRKLGRTVLHGGLACAGLGMIALVCTIQRDGLAASGWDLAGPLFVNGLGSGAIFVPLFDIILADLNDQEVGTGSGLLNATQQFAGALGVAVFGTLVFDVLAQQGWVDAVTHVGWAALACYALSFLVVFWLPKAPRGQTTGSNGEQLPTNEGTGSRSAAT